MTPRLIVDDVDAQVQFLRDVFGAEGIVEPGRPVEVRIGDSLVMISSTAERDPFPAFLYVYVDDADAAFERALQAGATAIDRTRSTRRTATGGRWCATRSATCSRSPTCCADERPVVDRRDLAR